MDLKNKYMKKKKIVNFLLGMSAAIALLWPGDRAIAQTADKAEPAAAAEIKTGTNCVLTLPGNVKLEMIWIEPGTFMMGSPNDEFGRNDNETQHQVTLTKGFWIGKYEVTQAQYKAVTGSDPSHFKGDDLPVEMVDWEESMEFCKKLTESLGGALPKGYKCSLPTEAQWEYACRAGTTSPLNNGKSIQTREEKCDNLDEVAWYKFNSNGTTHPVGQKKPNAWGLSDMHGNACEWCLDWIGNYPATPVTDPAGPDKGTQRSDRGAGWYWYPRQARSGHRGLYPPERRYFYLGFRLAIIPVVEK